MRIVWMDGWRRGVSEIWTDRQYLELAHRDRHGIDALDADALPFPSCRRDLQAGLRCRWEERCVVLNAVLFSAVLVMEPEREATSALCSNSHCISKPAQHLYTEVKMASNKTLIPSKDS